VPQHLDASIDVFRQRRSQLDSLDCEQTDGGGRASAGFDAQDGQAYLIRISRRVGSVAGPFRLTSAAVQPAARPPGPRLPAAGARNSVNRTLNPSDAYSVRLRQGVTYRVNLAVSRCANLEIYRPGTRSFSGGSRVETLSCGGRSDLLLDLRTPGTFDLMLLSERGGRLRCVCQGKGDLRLRTRLSRGRYFAAVRAQQQSRAGYRLTRVTRAITATRISVNGSSRATVAPGAVARLGRAGGREPFPQGSTSSSRSAFWAWRRFSA
jgi:hypothetical protein